MRAQWRRRRGRLPLLMAVAAASAALAIVAYAAGLFGSLELASVDTRFAVRGAQSAPRDLIVVGIDEQTLSMVRAPFPRADDAAVIARLARAGARVIAYDIEFSATDTTRLRYCPAFQGDVPVDDCALVTATIDAGNVVFAADAVNAAGQPNTFGGTNLRLLNATAGHTDVPTDSDGTVRRYFYRWQGIPSFAVAVWERAKGRRVPASVFGERAEGAPAAWIDFRGPPGTIPEISYGRVLRGEFPPGEFRGKIVVVGSVASALKDVFHTSVGGGRLMSGPELNAEAIDTVRRGNPLTSAPGAVEVALICLLALVAAGVSGRVGPLVALLITALAAAVYAIAVQLAFNAGVVVDLTYPLLALILAAIGALGVNYVTETIERQRIRATFARFVPEEVVDQALANADEDLRLGAVKRDGTVMFCDVRGFTSFAESLPVERVLNVLNGYLTEMSEAILAHGGTVVTYLGDGIMAVFGAPIAQDDHAERALAAAREMLGTRLGRVNESMRHTSLGWAFQVGIGISSGQVMSGHVGSARRLEYTAVGDTTNTAARLEEQTKQTSYDILIAEATRARLKHPPPDLFYVGELELRGRSEPVKVWTLAPDRGGRKLAAGPVEAVPDQHVAVQPGQSLR